MGTQMGTWGSGFGPKWPSDPLSACGPSRLPDLWDARKVSGALSAGSVRVAGDERSAGG